MGAALFQPPTILFALVVGVKCHESNVSRVVGSFHEKSVVVAEAHDNLLEMVAVVCAVVRGAPVPTAVVEFVVSALALVAFVVGVALVPVSLQIFVAGVVVEVACVPLLTSAVARPTHVGVALALASAWPAAAFRALVSVVEAAIALVRVYVVGGAVVGVLVLVSPTTFAAVAPVPAFAVRVFAVVFLALASVFPDLFSVGL